MLVDSHAHLDFPEFEDDRGAVVLRAWESGVQTIIIPGIDGDSSTRAAALSERFPHIWFAAGWHPHDAESLDEKRLRRLLHHPKCVAAGEIGLDFYRDHCPRDIQESAFRRQLKIAVERGLPVIFHIREAWPEARAIIDEFNPVRGVLHSFSGSEEDLRWALDRGFYIGLGGPVTFKNFKKTELIESIPPGSILTETDCPYLAPQSHRGHRNEPSFIPEIAGRLAEITGLDIGDFSRITSQNAAGLFGIPLPRTSGSKAPKKRFSQVFLIDKNIARKICELGGSGALCVEIGAGNGELTALLEPNFRRLWAFEPDWDRMDGLKRAAPDAMPLPKRFQDIDLSGLLFYEGKRAVVIGNLPYGETSPILFHLLEHRDAVERAVITVQREYALRLCARPGNKEYGIPSVLFSLFFGIKPEFNVPPTCFRPAPGVESTVLTLEPSGLQLSPNVPFDLLKKTVKSAFAHRRKTVYNSLRMELPEFDIEMALSAAQIDSRCRAENISPPGFVALAEAVGRQQGT